MRIAGREVALVEVAPGMRMCMESSSSNMMHAPDSIKVNAEERGEV